MLVVDPAPVVTVRPSPAIVANQPASFAGNTMLPLAAAFNAGKIAVPPPTLSC